VKEDIKQLFKADLDRLKRLFKINNIRTFSDSAIVNRTMKLATPVIQDIKVILQQYITQELLKEDTKSKEFTINVDDLWEKVSKALAQFQSTLTDEELKFQDQIIY
jgi:Skp family chaperone for outer membrane proteins